MPRRRIERGLIRSLIFAALSCALLASVVIPVPRNAQGEPNLPGPAFEQVSLYRLEVALLTFYGGLLLVTPAYSGLVRGRLPTEISARGAKFAEEANQSAELTDLAIKQLRRTTNDLTAELAAANLQIRLLKGDKTQPAVGSKQ